jgi:hypothetical protein
MVFGLSLPSNTYPTRKIESRVFFMPGAFKLLASISLAGREPTRGNTAKQFLSENVGLVLMFA